MVLFLCRIDYSNLGYALAKALQSVGVRATAVATTKHGFFKTNCTRVITTEEILTLIDTASVIIWMHSQPIAINKIKELNKTKIVFHGGTPYRRNPKKINKIFNNISNLSIIQTGDLLELGAKNERWLLPPIDTELIQPVYDSIGKRKIFAHFPSKSNTKGTKLINQIMSEFSNDPTINKQFIYKFSAKSRNWEKNINRMKMCDIYIDAFCPILEGKRYGEWGIQTLEAAALGKIVVTHFGTYKRYEKEYGPCPLQYANTETELRQRIFNLIITNDLLPLKQTTRKWVEKYHSLQAIGSRLEKIISKANEISNVEKIITKPVETVKTIKPKKNVPVSAVIGNKKILKTIIVPAIKRNKQGNACG
jgi:hypothetical protein